MILFFKKYNKYIGECFSIHLQKFRADKGGMWFHLRGLVCVDVVNSLGRNGPKQQTTVLFCPCEDENDSIF